MTERMNREMKIDEAPVNDHRLVLGTVQLGMPYGIANTTGQPDMHTAEAIIQKAWEGGVREFDTAQAYGSSQKVLGKAIVKHRLTGNARITTKLSPDIDHTSKRAVFSAVERSLEDLGVSKLHCLLVHRERLLNQWESGIGRIMTELIEAGFLDHAGISVYSPQSALMAVSIDEITVIQIPSNILDRRFERIGIFDQHRHTKKQVYVRSVFLQGLLLMNPYDLNTTMRFARSTLISCESLAASYGISKLELALGYVKTAYPEAKIIIGAETCSQLDEVLAAWKTILPRDLLDEVRHSYADVDETITNPTAWPNRSDR